MKRAHERISDLASFLDSQHKADQAINVRGSRSYLRQWFKPAKRGGPLLVGAHELVISPAPVGVPLDQAELL
jgi:hypothetical protein